MLLEQLALSGLPLEKTHSAFGVDQFLLAGEEGVAVCTDFDSEGVTFDGGTSLPRSAAGARYFYFVIIGVDSSLHGGNFLSFRPFVRLTQGDYFAKGWPLREAGQGSHAIFNLFESLLSDIVMICLLYTSDAADE